MFTTSTQRRMAPDARLQKIRQYEDTKREQVQLAQSYRRADQISEFEKLTDAKIKANLVKQRFQKLRAAAAEKLDERRARLRALLDAEEGRLQAELRVVDPTPEERRAGLEARARALREKREAERFAYAEAQRMRKWREGCDTVRTLESKSITRATAEARKEQLEEHRLARALEAEEARAHHEQMLEGQERMEQRYERDMRHRKELDAEAVHILDEQVALMREMRHEQLAKIEAEVAEMKARWAAEEAQFQAHEAGVRERNKRIAKELVAYNIEQKEQQARQEEEDRRIERYIVQLATRKEREEEQRERHLKDRQREEARMYRQHLLLMMQREQASESERDAIVKAEQDREWERREAQWRKEMQARAALLEEVYNSREEQLREKENMRRREEEEKQRELQALQQELEQMRLDEEKKMRELSLNKKLQFEEIDAQVRQKQLMDLVKTQQEKREFEEAVAQEKEYKEMVQRTEVGPPPPNRYNRKTAQWYF